MRLLAADKELARLRAIERELAREMRKIRAAQNAPSATTQYEHVREMRVNLQRQIASLSAKQGEQD